MMQRKKIDNIDTEELKKNANSFKDKIDNNLNEISEKKNIPKKYLIGGIIAIILIIVSFIFSGGNSYINKIKNGYLSNYKSTTIGDAFDNWSYCENPEWSEFETKNKMKVVQFSCDYKYTDEIRNLVNYTKNPKMKKLYNVKSIKPIVQFLINKDGTFKINYMAFDLKWKDGVKEETSSFDFLNEIYQNKGNLLGFETLKKAANGNPKEEAAHWNFFTDTMGTLYRAGSLQN